MTTSSVSLSSMAWLAVAAGVVALIGLLFLIVFFIIGEPFGTLNDASIALAGLLSGVLAWRVWAGFQGQSPPLSDLALAAAVVGALVVVLGSALVIFHVTGWVLAGFYVAFGNALIGLWLLRLRYSAQVSGACGWAVSRSRTPRQVSAPSRARGIERRLISAAMVYKRPSWQGFFIFP